MKASLTISRCLPMRGKDSRNMKIIFSKHAEMKIKERKVKKENIEKTLKEPDFVFYDLHTRSLINIAKINIDDVPTNLVVVYTKQEDTIKIITVYPCKDIERNKKEGGEKVGKDEVKMWYDEEIDILYLSIKEGESVDSEEVGENIRIEYNKDGEVVGLEISDISKYLAKYIAEKLEGIVAKQT